MLFKWLLKTEIFVYIFFYLKLSFIGPKICSGPEVYHSTKICVVFTQKNSLSETDLVKIQNKGYKVMVLFLDQTQVQCL